MSGAVSQLSPRVRLSFGDPRFVVILVVGLALAALPVAGYYGEGGFLDNALGINTFTTNFFAKILIFALAAASLDLLVGYGGMVSFGHAAYLGLGTYAVGIGSYYAFELCLDAESIAACQYGWMQSGFFHFPVAIVASALVAFLIGAISLRTSGLYFIMITFAFTQMLFFLGISLEPYGGDDGMSFDRSTFFGYPTNTNILGPEQGRPEDVLIYYMAFGALVLCVFLLRRLVNSRFGMVIRGTYSNPIRMATIGFPTYRYRLTAFVIAGAMCGLAGALFANHQAFLTPEYMSWIISGDLLFMVIMGGMGTIFGPIAGALAFFGLDEWLKSIPSIGEDYRLVVFGPLLIMLVLFARRGIFGWIPDRWSGMGRFFVGAIAFLLGFELFILHLAEIHPLGVIASLIVAATLGRALLMFFTSNKMLIFTAAMALFIFGNIITVLIHPEGTFSAWAVAVLVIDAALVGLAWAIRPFMSPLARFFKGKDAEETQHA